MIQDIAPHRYSNAYTQEKPEGNSYLLCYSGRNVCVKRTEDGRITFPTFKEAAPYNAGIYEQYIYLFAIDGDRFYLGRDIACGKLTGYEFDSTGIFRDAGPKHLAFAGITGAQLDRWYQSHQFCGRCGKQMQPDGRERMLCCPECGGQEYPKIMPAVIVGVTHGNRLLMSKYAGREFKKYALLAGFAEIGESIEETVRREVMEEVGLAVRNIRFYKSQPWSFSDTLLLGFYADLDGEEDITLDRQELALAKWFEREEIPVEKEDLSLTNEMIMQFKNGEM